MELVRGRPSREEKGQRASWRREVWRSGAKASMGGGGSLEAQNAGFPCEIPEATQNRAPFTVPGSCPETSTSSSPRFATAGRK